MEAFGGINLMKAALFYADHITTVSPSYAEELTTEPGGCGLSVYVNRRREDLTGILNGIDEDHWDPKTDVLIPATYSTRSLKGKVVCKKALQKEFLLEENPGIPVIGIVTRFAEQKGLSLLASVIGSMVEAMRVQIAILGSGEKWMEDFFGHLPAAYPGKIGAWIGYSDHKAHLIEAGSDFFLMPSLYEPCGLNQMYSLKYGTLPIVRATGGLRDTVKQYNENTGEGTGFLFDAATPGAVYDTVGWAVSTFYDRPDHLITMQKRAMKEDFSWLHAAEKYSDVYDRALLRRASWTL